MTTKYIAVRESKEIIYQGYDKDAAIKAAIPEEYFFAQVFSINESARDRRVTITVMNPMKGKKIEEKTISLERKIFDALLQDLSPK